MADVAQRRDAEHRDETQQNGVLAQALARVVHAEDRHANTAWMARTTPSMWWFSAIAPQMHCTANTPSTTDICREPMPASSPSSARHGRLDTAAHIAEYSLDVAAEEEDRDDDQDRDEAEDEAYSASP